MTLPACVFSNNDYKQLEVRVGAWLSNDAALIEACKDDVHTVVNNRVFGHIIAELRECVIIDNVLEVVRKHKILIDFIARHVQKPYTDVEKFVKEIIKFLRDKCKNITFGVMYGREAYSLAHGELNCPEKDAQKYIDRFFTEFSTFAAYLEEQKRYVLTRQWLETPFGRRRRFPYLNEEFTKRVIKQTTNMPIQSVANDICLKAFIKLNPELRKHKYGGTKFPVHDALAFSLRLETVKEALALIRYHMEETTRPVGVDLRFNIDQEIGPSYKEMIPVAVYLEQLGMT